MTNRRQPFIINLLEVLSTHSGSIASLIMCLSPVTCPHYNVHRVQHILLWKKSLER